jgi:hypothetical protein
VAEVALEVKLTDDGFDEEQVRPGGALFTRETVPAKPYRLVTVSVSWMVDPEVVVAG